MASYFLRIIRVLHRLQRFHGQSTSYNFESGFKIEVNLISLVFLLMFLVIYLLMTFYLVKAAQIFRSFNSVVYFVGIQIIDGTALVFLILLAFYDMVFHKTLSGVVVEIEAIYQQVRCVEFSP